MRYSSAALDTLRDLAAPVYGEIMHKLVPKSGCFLFGFCLLAAGAVFAQGVPLPIEMLPLGKDIGISSGQTVTPAYEGWYEDDDGMIALSFGYYNRNTEEVLEIPAGAENRIIGAPDGDPDQGQPTRFEVDRHWGVFTVKVPPGFGEPVIWRLENQGKTFDIRANLNTNYIIDAIAGDANGNFPPRIRFAEDADWGHGPAGVTAGPLETQVGVPLAFTAWVEDRGEVIPLFAQFLGGGSGKPPVTVAWLKQQGPGDVIFSETSARVAGAGGAANTSATCGEPGLYLLRARVTEFTGPAMAGHAQCCWTNGFVKVNVSE